MKIASANSPAAVSHIGKTEVVFIQPCAKVDNEC